METKPQAITNAKPREESAAQQRARLLPELIKHPLTTPEIRHDLDILMPAARVFELRRDGHDIKTERVPALNPGGTIHNVARYVYRGGPADRGDHVEG